eukprot:279973_1
MRHPKEKKMYCKKCKKHQKFKVTQYKPGAASNFTQGRRRWKMKVATLHNPRYPKSKPINTMPVFRKKAKSTKKITVRNKCTVCGHIIMTTLSRNKTFELIPENQRKTGCKSTKIYG